MSRVLLDAREGVRYSYLCETSKEFGLLIFVGPLKISQEVDGTTQRVEQINNRGTVTLHTLRFELK